MPDRDWWKELWPDPESVLRRLGLIEGMVAIDLCCGDGYFTAPLAKLVGRPVYGVDLDPVMLEPARAEVEHAGAPPCIWICGDARELTKLVPEQADYLLLANTFHGVSDKPGLARETAAALKPGGRFAVINWHRRPRAETTVLGRPRGPKTELRMTPEDTQRFVETAGFRLERIVELPPYHYAAIFVKTEP